jgi:hypothetical protein
MPKRVIVCQCGHKMKAPDDEALFWEVQRHVDDRHFDLRYTEDDIRKLVESKAYTEEPTSSRLATWRDRHRRGEI